MNAESTQEAVGLVTEPSASVDLVHKSFDSSHDERESLVNAGERGPAHVISVGVDEVAAIRGFLIDVDCDLLDPDIVGDECVKCSLTLFGKHMRTWLSRDPVLAKAEVRATSALGLHVIFTLDEPILCGPDHARLYDSIVKGARSAMPGDPLVNGLIAMTRPIGAKNTKYTPPYEVQLLKEGEPVSQAEIIDLARRVGSQSAVTWMRVLYGGERLVPCPLCSIDGSSLGIAGAAQVRCYKCGRSAATRLLYRFYRQGLGDAQKEGSHHGDSI